MLNILMKIPILRSAIRGWRAARFKKNWREHNRHNRTVAMNIFPIECVKVGRDTYGELHIMSYFPETERLDIGNYVSIAPNVKFILSGNHQTETLFTYPIQSSLLGQHCMEDSLSKGPVTVEDEAWIGYGAIILSGVTIGKSSIVAAGSVVTHDIPPYAIAGGNPAKVIRYRLPKEIIPMVDKIRLTDIPENVLKRNIKALYKPLRTTEDAAELLKTLENGNK